MFDDALQRRSRVTVAAEIGACVLGPDGFRGPNILILILVVLIVLQALTA